MQRDRAVPCLSVAGDRDRDPVATRAVVRALAEQSGAAVEPVGYLELTGARLRARPAPSAPPSTTREADPTVVCVGTGAHRADVLANARAVLGARTVPLLVIGTRCRPPLGRYERLVVAVDASTGAAPIAATASRTAHRLGLEVVFTVVVTSAAATLPAAIADADESGFLRGLRRDVGEPAAAFDTLHDAEPARGIVRYAGHDGRVIVAVGLPAAGRHGVHRAGRVTRTVLRHAACPVLLVPAGAPPPSP